MNSLFDKMMNQIKGHERTHIRVRINNKIVLIKQLYEQLMLLIIWLALQIILRWTLIKIK